MAEPQPQRKQSTARSRRANTAGIHGNHGNHGYRLIERAEDGNKLAANGPSFLVVAERAHLLRGRALIERIQQLLELNEREAMPELLLGRRHLGGATAAERMEAASSSKGKTGGMEGGGGRADVWVRGCDSRHARCPESSSSA